MKTLNKISLLLSFYFFMQLSISLFAQPSHSNQAFMTLNTTVNPDKLEDSWNRADPNLTFWSNFDLSVGISINYFLSFGLPFEIAGNYSDVDNQTTACINDWDTYMCIDLFNCFNMGYNLTGNSVTLEFSTNPQFFTNVQTTLGTTRLAVIEDNDVYWLKLYHQFSLTNTQQTQIYFNDCNDFIKDWSVEEQYVSEDDIPIKPVILHELGHIMGLGHNNWSNGAGTLVMYTGLVNEPNMLLFYLTVWDKVGIDAYWIHQGYLQNPAILLEINPIHKLLNKRHAFFEYEPAVLLYSQRKTVSAQNDKENAPLNTSSCSDKKLFIKPENNIREGVRK